MANLETNFDKKRPHARVDRFLSKHKRINRIAAFYSRHNREIHSATKTVAMTLTALIFLWGLMTFSVDLGSLYLDSFPSIGIAAVNATALLNAIIQVDSILVGFLSIAFAGILSGLQSQISDWNEYIRMEVIRPPEETDDVGLTAYQEKISKLRKSIRLIVFLVSLFLIAMVLSIFSALSTLANISISLPRRNIASSITPLFAGIIILFSIIYVGFAQVSGG